MNLKGRDFLKLLDYSEEEIRYLLDLAKKFKVMKHKGKKHKYFEGKMYIDDRYSKSFPFISKSILLIAIYIDNKQIILKMPFIVIKLVAIPKSDKLIILVKKIVVTKDTNIEITIVTIFQIIEIKVFLPSSSLFIFFSSF